MLVRLLILFLAVSVALSQAAHLKDNAEIELFKRAELDLRARRLSQKRLRAVCKKVMQYTKYTITLNVPASTQIIDADVATIRSTLTVDNSMPAITSALTLKDDLGPLTVTSTITDFSVSTLVIPTYVVPIDRRAPKPAAKLAREYIKAFGKSAAREACVQVLYDGNEGRAPVNFITNKQVITSTIAPTTVTSLTTETKAVQTVYDFVTLTPTTTSLVTTTLSSTTTTTSPYSSLPTSSTDYCGPNADEDGCTCEAEPNSPVVRCDYKAVKRPARFIAPCDGQLDVTLLGAGGGKSASPFSALAAPGMLVYSNNGLNADPKVAGMTRFAAGTLFRIRVGGQGGQAEDPDSYGLGGFNGGGDGTCPNLPQTYCSGGGGGATEVSLNKVTLIAAGGAGGNAESSAGTPYDQGCTTLFDDAAPKGMNAGNGFLGGGGGGGYPGGRAGAKSKTGGYGGGNLIPQAQTDFDFSYGPSPDLGFLQGRATLRFSCLPPLPV